MPQQVTLTYSDAALVEIDAKATAAGLTREQYMEAQGEALAAVSQDHDILDWFKGLTQTERKAIYDANS